MIGTRLAHYEIIRHLGSGGMGDVYQATDSKLGRSVAIKFLPAAFASDPERLSRFRREAQLLASLSHPNICTLYDVGHEDGVDFLVMEYLEGQTLANRVAKGPVPIHETLQIAIHIAEALAKAHRAGITHRDLKPGNVMLTQVGAKLLDFGLARTLSVAMPGNVSALPTALSNLTAPGAILGTLPYMSPEQIEGADTDARCDIWALGCLIYEMVTARPAFSGGSQASLITSIMSREPEPTTAFQPGTPAALERLMRNCLVKDPNRRWQNALDVVLELKAIADDEDAPGSAESLKRQSWWPLAVGAFLVLLAVGLLSIWLGGRMAGVEPGAEIRFEFEPPPGNEFPQSVETVHLAISPDGLTLAFVAIDEDGVSRIWTRRVGELTSSPLPGTEGASSIVWSPDGRSVAYFGLGKLQRLDLPNGSPVTICDVSKGIGFAGSWGESGEILYASVQGDAIYRVAVTGGTPEKILGPDAARNELRVGWPRLLPGNRGYLYLGRSSEREFRLMWVEPGKPPRAVAPLASRFELMQPDLLVFVRDGALIAQRIDFSSGQLAGVPVSIAPRVGYFFSSGWAGFAVSPRGGIFYLTGENSSRLVWVNRAGKTESEVGERGDYLDIALSPDGRNAIAARRQPSLGTYDLWLVDVGRNVEIKMTSSPDADFGANWFPDGKSIVYSSVRGFPPNLIRRNLATGEEDVLLPRGSFQQSTDIARSGRSVLFTERGPDGGFHAMTLQIEGDRQPKSIFESDSRQEDVRFSRDGAFIAYRSDESGGWEAYVTPLANPSGRVRILQEGARRLRWRRDGAEVLLLTPSGKMIAVPVRTGPEIKIDPPVTLFTIPEGQSWFDFDVTSDGQRFLVGERLQTAGSHPASVILNWAPRMSQ